MPPALGARPDRYLLQAGLTPGGTEISAGLPLTGLTESFGDVPSGTYFLRVRAANTQGLSPASSDVVVTVGQSTCGAPLDPPSDLVASVTGDQVSLSWSPASGGAIASYRVEAGPSAGSTAVQVAVGAGQNEYTTTAPAGAYFVRVRALGPCGNSQASNEVDVRVGVAAAPAPPMNLATALTGSSVTVSWDASAGASGYVLEVGSAPGARDIGALPIVSTSFAAAGVPVGTYFLRVRAANEVGIGAASDEIVLVVP
jgi:predicted phage tail protein